MIIGASLLVYLLEVLRQFKATQEIVFGALLLAFVLFQPRGLVDFSTSGSATMASGY